MTNARAARQRNTREQRLIDERNALLDVLNAILQMVDGHMLAVDLKHYLGKPRHPVYTAETPQGFVVRMDTDQHVTGDNKALFVAPGAEV